MAQATFREWLEGQMESKGISRRELARRLATSRADNGKHMETQRRHVKRILNGQVTRPTQATRNAICDALELPRDSAPKHADDEEVAQVAALDADEVEMLTALMSRLGLRVVPATESEEVFAA